MTSYGDNIHSKNVYAKDYMVAQNIFEKRIESIYNYDINVTVQNPSAIELPKNAHVVYLTFKMQEGTFADQTCTIKWPRYTFPDGRNFRLHIIGICFHSGNGQTGPDINHIVTQDEENVYVKRFSSANFAADSYCVLTFGLKYDPGEE